MILCLLCLCIVFPSVLTTISKDALLDVYSCSLNEYQCNDGACVSAELICNNQRDCADGSDEMECGVSQSSLPYGDTVLNRLRRDKFNCRKDQWICQDGTCIDFNKKCDEVVDCPDASDEGDALCWKNHSPVTQALQCVRNVGTINQNRSSVPFEHMKISPSSQQISPCRSSEYLCNDGKCVSDEKECGVSQSSLPFGEIVLNRTRRQLSQCRQKQWGCRDGTCIQFDGKCDGVVDCPDGSDETHALCWKNMCQSNWFRCTYGACVDGTAPCNGLQECADNSDELLPRCRNETQEIRGQFKCADGSTIPASGHCDGAKDCADGSDETIRTCAGISCPPYLFQCAYGACVDNGADCNKVQECADNSDESEELCGSRNNTVVTIRPTTGNCVLPPFPEHGTYTTNILGAGPGMSYKYVTLNVTCYRGYGVDGPSKVPCQDGLWQSNVPKCVRQCRLEPHISVEYMCLVSGAITGHRACNLYEPDETLVQPICRRPNYYYPSTLSYMRCKNGYWNYVARCKPECGTVTPDGIELVYGGVSAKKGELPWHAGIYQKTFSPYMQVCGGSLISNNVIISAAHCFWNDLQKKLPESQFAVAVGKIYRPWNDSHDDAQKSDVKEIHIPTRFQGAGSNFQDDIALVIVLEAFEYKTFIRPVCLSFEIVFEKQQLQPSNFGKVAGWGVTSANGKASPVLQVVQLPYVDVATCIDNSPHAFRPFITSDKICAGTTDSTTALCKGDSGGGLAFPTLELAVERYYLRGIVSTAPNNENVCNLATYTSFTQIMNHEQFIKRYWTDSY